MQQGQQLLAVMNEVSARLDHAPASLRPIPRTEAITEMQAFMQLDPLLSGLNKEYLDAKGARLQAEKEFGRGDGMAGLAVLMEDSAWCAVQTRYMELRADRRMMAQAQSLMEESRLEEEERTRKEKDRAALKTFEQMQMFLRMREARKDTAAGWWLFLMLFMTEPVPFRAHHASHRFNLMAA